MPGKPNNKIFKSMIAKYGSEEAAREHYRQLGAKGGKVSTPTGGFGSSHELAVGAGRLGGLASRKKKNETH